MLFGAGPDLGKMQLRPAGAGGYKIRARKDGSVKISVSRFPAGAPAKDFGDTVCHGEVFRAESGGEGWLVVTLPPGFMPKADKDIAAAAHESYPRKGPRKTAGYGV